MFSTAGWKKTFQGYFDEDVKVILGEVLKALTANEARRFIWSEVSFFEGWYSTLEDEDRNKFKDLVRSGRFEFVGGGWVQHDEALNDLYAILDHMTEGHKYLLANFGVRPKIGWQIDTFGHSSLTPMLFPLMGLKGKWHFCLGPGLRSDFLRDLRILVDGVCCAHSLSLLCRFAPQIWSSTG